MEAGLRTDVERWLVHKGVRFYDKKSPDNVFEILVKEAGTAGVPVGIFEPRSQPGVLVIGSKVAMSNRQTSRYREFSDEEKEGFEKKVAEYCRSIRAVNRNSTEDGRRMIGVYVVLDGEGQVNQDGLFEAMDTASEMHEKLSRFLMKTF